MELQTRKSMGYYHLYTRTGKDASRVKEDLQSLQKENILCDVTLETEDGTKVRGHKVIFASASPYFRAMFTSFIEKTNDLVIIKQVDSSVLKLIVDFIYSGQILLTEENVQDLLAASNLLQLQEIHDECCDLLKTNLHPTNCLGIWTIADLHSCNELLSYSESYIGLHFSEVVKNDEFLSLTVEQLVKLISSDELTVQSEEKVFECVVFWVNFAPSSRVDVFSKLLEHVRFPLITKEYLLNTVSEEPLVKKSPECFHYIDKALRYQLLNCDQPGIIQSTICKNRRQSEVILVISGHNDGFEWYDPVNNRWQLENKRINNSGFIPSKDGRMFPMSKYWKEVKMLNLSSTKGFCWVLLSKMLTERKQFSLAVLNNCIYAFGGYINSILESAEVFNCSTHSWSEISRMSNCRHSCGVGVLDNHIYVLGGSSSYDTLKSVERYDPNTNEWSPVAEMNTNRCDASVGVLDGILYAIGGHYRHIIMHSSVEAYNPHTRVWTRVAPMHIPRAYAGVVTLNGLLYVVGGKDESWDETFSVEVYNPRTNAWKMLAATNNGPYAAVITVDKLHLDEWLLK